MEDGTPPMLGRRVAVYGGGNTAMDAARTARRLGAADAVVVYRRSRDRMPAHDIEVEEALEEGVTMRWLSTVTHAEAGSLTIEKMRLDDTGRDTPQRHALARYDSLNTWYYSDAPAAVRPKLAAARRTGTFDEATGGLDASTALFEARRCLSCGNCFDCDNCYGACLDNAVIKTASGGCEIDYDYCKGCGICATECPCGAIAMVPEGT